MRHEPSVRQKSRGKIGSYTQTFRGKLRDKKSNHLVIVTLKVREQKFSVECTEIVPSPTKIPMAGGGSYWQAPIHGRTVVRLAEDSLPHLHGGPYRLDVKGKTFSFQPDRFRGTHCEASVSSFANQSEGATRDNLL